MKTILALSLIVAAGRIFAQAPLQVPTVVLDNPDTCTRYESDLVRCADWLEETDLNKEKAKRQEAIDFVLQWHSSCKSVAIEVNDEVGVIYGRNDPLLGIYIASYIRYIIGHRDAPSKFEATKAGVLSMMKVYQKGISIQKSKEMEVVIKRNKEGKLDEYIEKVMRVAKE